MDGSRFADNTLVHHSSGEFRGLSSYDGKSRHFRASEWFARDAYKQWKRMYATWSTYRTASYDYAHAKFVISIRLYASAAVISAESSVGRAFRSRLNRDSRRSCFNQKLPALALYCLSISAGLSNRVAVKFSAFTSARPLFHFRVTEFKAVSPEIFA